MKPQHGQPLLRSFLALLALALAGPATAQQPPPVAPNPMAPVLKPVVPLGMQRGTTLDVTLTGANLADPTGVWASFPAKVTIPTEGNNGKESGKLVVRLEVPADAPMGFHTLRLATGRGMSNLRMFCIDDLPQVLRADSNRTRATAQAVPVPCVVCGKADTEVSDWYKVSVKAGERVSFEVLGRRLGSALDPQLTLYDPRTGKELPGGHSNDAPGLQTDPRLTYTFKEAGDYLVEVRDVSYRGGDDFHYRLRIGDFPCATTPVPLAVKRGAKTTVHFAGPAVEGAAPVAVTAPTDPDVQAVWVTPKGANGLHGWPVSLLLSDLDETVEQEPNNELAKANRVPVPGAVTGRFLEKGDVDYYVFAAKKGQRYVIDGQTGDLHSPTELYMAVKDAKGAQLQASNPMAGARLDFTPQADGDFYLAVEHLHSWGGPSETYRIAITPYEPGFELSVGIERFDVSQSGVLAIPILVQRRDYTGPIEVSVVGAGLSGTLTIPAGAPAQPNLPAGVLAVTAAADLPLGPREFKVVGKATVNGKEVVRYASVRAAVSQALANLPVPPRTMYEQLFVAITEKAPFTLSAKFDQESAMPGKPAPLTVTVTRDPGFTAEIALTAVGLPPNVAPALKPIPANMDEVKVQLNPAANAPVGSFTITINGKAKHQNKDFSASALVPLVLKK
jgi:hypothetical protein